MQEVKIIETDGQ